MLKNRWAVLLPTIKRKLILGILPALLCAFSIALVGGPGAASAASLPTMHKQQTIVLSSLIIRAGPASIESISLKHALTSLSPLASRQDQCLSEMSQMDSPGDNLADAFGTTRNDCPATVNGTQYWNVYTSCPGYGRGGSFSAGFRLVIYESFEETLLLGAGCVVCHYTNGVLSGESYPDFVLLENVSASGSFSFHNLAYSATSDIASSNAYISNNGRYAPPCPITG